VTTAARRPFDTKAERLQQARHGGTRVWRLAVSVFLYPRQREPPKLSRVEVKKAQSNRCGFGGAVRQKQNFEDRAKCSDSRGPAQSLIPVFAKKSRPASPLTWSIPFAPDFNVGGSCSMSARPCEKKVAFCTVLGADVFNIEILGRGDRKLEAARLARRLFFANTGTKLPADVPISSTHRLTHSHFD